MPRRAVRVLTVLAVLVALSMATVFDASRQRALRAGTDRANADLVRQLGLTDLSLFTEASYTRHPSHADRHSAFQDGPGTPEHFPSGSLIQPNQVR